MACYEYEGKLCEIVVSEKDPTIFRFFVDKSLVTEGEKNKYYYTVCKKYFDDLKNFTLKPEVIEVKKENDNYYLELQCEKKLFNGFMLLTSAKKIRVLFDDKNKIKQLTICV